MKKTQAQIQHERNLVKRSERFFEIEQYRHDNGKRQVAPISKCIRFEADAAEHADDNGDPVESSLLTDNGLAAALIRLCGEKPEWLGAFEAACKKLDLDDLLLVMALADDWTDRGAAYLSGRSKSAVSRFKKRLPSIFGEAFRKLDPAAYARWQEKHEKVTRDKITRSCD